MDIHTFINNYREAFGQQTELPIAFWYSDQLETSTEKVNGCFFKAWRKSEAENNQPQRRDNKLRWRQVLHRLHRYAGACARFRFFKREIQENT